MSGGGIGGALGTALGVALAPETGGLSMAIPAIAGAGGAYIGGKVGGDKNPLMDALMGGIGGGLTGGLSGGFDAAGMFGDAGASGAEGAAEGISPALSAADPSLGIAGAQTGINAGGAMSGASDLTPGTENFLSNLGADNSISPALAAADPSLSAGTQSGSGMAGWLGKQNPLALALAGSTGLSALQSVMNPLPKYNVQGNANNVMATNPGFNATLPKYSMQNTASPYNGNWYTYGENPQTAMYNAQPVLQQAKGGLIPHYAKGGFVHKYALGGPVAPMAMAPQVMSPQNQVPQPSMPSKQVNPLAIKQAHDIGVALGRHLKNKITTPDGQVRGPGGGQDDAIPARLSQDEFILPADVVSQLGDGSSNAGGKRLVGMIHNVRQHKATKHFPPKAKNPLSYLPKKAKA